jgi:peptidase E
MRSAEEKEDSNTPTPKHVIEEFTALKEHMLCVHFMITMHINMGNKKIKSKMSEEERNAFWTIVDRQMYVY